MFEFRADIHIHTVLSPCADLEMSPGNIITTAAAKGLDILGITDHNSTRQCELLIEMGKEKGIFVLPGAEVNTKEEVHCLTFFENIHYLNLFQNYLDTHLPDIKNEPAILGYQVVVNRSDEILYEEKRSLFSSINQSVEQVRHKVKELGGLFIPAHIDRSKNSIYSQLGFFPDGLDPDAVEVSWRTNLSEFLNDHPELKDFTCLTSSDAHFTDDIARVYSLFRMKERSFKEIKLALKQELNRKLITL